MRQWDENLADAKVTPWVRLLLVKLMGRMMARPLATWSGCEWWASKMGSEKVSGSLTETRLGVGWALATETPSWGFQMVIMLVHQLATWTGFQLVIWLATQMVSWLDLTTAELGWWYETGTQTGSARASQWHFLDMYRHAAPAVLRSH